MEIARVHLLGAREVLERGDADDRDLLVRTILDSLVTVVNGPVQPLSWAYEPDVATYQFDPKRAAALLDEAGWKPGPDGVRAGGDVDVVAGVDGAGRQRFSALLRVLWEPPDAQGAAHQGCQRQGIAVDDHVGAAQPAVAAPARTGQPAHPQLEVHWRLPP